MKLRMKNFNIWAFTEKSDFQRGNFTKKQIKRRDWLKRGLGQFADLRGGLVKKEKVVFFEGGLIH